MPKKHRLSRPEFAALPRAASRRVGGDLFSLRVAKIPGGASVKIACVVSKKVAARASARNAIRRRCREAARAELARIKEPCTLVFYAKREAAEATFSDLKRDVEKLVARI